MEAELQPRKTWFKWRPSDSDWDIRRDRINQLRQEGKTGPEIAAIFGCHFKTYRNWITFLAIGASRRPYSEQDIAEIRANRLAGMSYLDIAKKYHRDGQVVRRLCADIHVHKKAHEWPPERIERLKELRSFGYSAGMIGKELGHTRSSIIGKLYRLGIVGESTIHMARTPRLPSGATKRRGRRAKPRRKSGIPFLFQKFHGSEPPTPEYSHAADLATPQEQRRTLLQLAGNDCRWPVGNPEKSDFFFCGAVAHIGYSYCTAHCARAFV